jgi:hypothetical protein
LDCQTAELVALSAQMDPARTGAAPLRGVEHCAPAPDVVRCPECAATSPSVEALSSHFVSLHCMNCGEVWLVRERRPLLMERKASD